MKGDPQVSLTDKYQKLSEIDHVLIRPTMYFGSDQEKMIYDWSLNDDTKKIEWKDVNILPAFEKLFDEIISNSVDHSRRTEGSHLNQIKVYYNDTDPSSIKITVSDNGGIPIEIHPVYNQYIPDIIFGELRSGSNYNDTDQRTGTGTNGLGAKLVNIFSSEFKVSTYNDGLIYSKRYFNNMKSSDKEIIKEIPEDCHIKQGTEISYILDQSKLIIPDDVRPYLKERIKKRCIEIAACNPYISVYFNQERISFKSFKDFIELFNNDMIYHEIITDHNNKWKIGLCHSDSSGFGHVSFINSTSTYGGGSHVDIVIQKLVEGIRGYIEKKTKIKVKPNDIKSQFMLFLDATIINPKYQSQTKETLVSSPSSFGIQTYFDDKFIQKLCKSEVMKKIIDWVTRKREEEDAKGIQAELDKIKKQSFHHIPKYHGASLKNRQECILFLCEGDSALSCLRAAKQPHHGLFPLRGKPYNVIDAPIKKLMDQVEFQHILQIIGLDLKNKSCYDENFLRYNSIVIAADSDLDGIHIRGLLIVAFSKFFPKLLDNGFIKILKTPVVLVDIKKEDTQKEFFTIGEFQDWERLNKNKIKSIKYLKGLGSHSTKNMKKYMDDKSYMYTIDALDDEDKEFLNLAFHPTLADERKEWLGL